MKKLYSQSGFSLIETLVAITILLVIIVGPLTLVSSSARSTNFASEQVVAFFLAQEGAEFAQKARDDLVLPRFLPGASPTLDPWADFVNANGAFRHCFNPSGCGLSVANDTAGTINVSSSFCPANGCPLYRYETETPDQGMSQTPTVRAYYSHTPISGQTVSTQFTRSIRYEAVTGQPDQLRVVSTVRWFTGSINAQQEVQVETYLFDVYGVN